MSKHISSQQLTTIDQRLFNLDLACVVRIFWGYRWLIILITALASGVSVIYALSLPNLYRAEALVAPAAQTETSALSGIASQYAGIAGLAGVNLSRSGSSSDEIDWALEVLRSRKFIREFVERHQIEGELLASKGWDSVEDKIVYDERVYDVKNRLWKGQSSYPSETESRNEFLKIVSLLEDEDTGFIRVRVEHLSPQLAKQWVDLLVNDINAHMRTRAISESERSIVFLQEQLATTSLSDMQTIFYQLIQEQTKTMMLANARPEYLFVTIDPAVVPEFPSKPNRALVCIMGALLGGMVAFLSVVLITVISHIREGLG